MRIFLHLTFLMIVLTCEASYGESYYFGGGGLSYTQSRLELNSTKADFRGSTYSLSAGAVYGGGKDSTGLLLRADIGRGSSYNLLKSHTYMEMIESTFAVGKAGILFGYFAVGGGYQYTTLEIKSVSSTTGAKVTKYTEAVPVYFLSYTVPNAKKIRTELELQYIASKIGAAQYEEVSLHLMLSMIFD